ncbi:MAG: hypothetical protein EXS13_06975 [Planctomycetes bacterium]|nr:hypothetical protein [Planctomycetota bacterium]
MDASNLIPPNPARPASVARRPYEAAPTTEKAARAAAAGANSRRGASSDRIERSPELEAKLTELKRQLDRQPDYHPVDLEAIRADLAETRHASRETLLRAAAGILEGEIFFTQT